MPSAPPGHAVYLDDVLAWTEAAPIGRCKSCTFSAPLSARKLCAACEVDRLLAAAGRAVNSPAALADEAEIVIRGGELP